MTTDITQLGTILGIWAHPDDEVFLSGGLMAAARDAGQRVVCVTATMGEHGTSDPRAWPPARLGRARAKELKASLAMLGVREHHALGIVDGTCAAQPALAMVERIASIVERVRPDTIVTFGPDGLTGHEDHQTVSVWATAARNLVAPQARLLYATTTDEFTERWQHIHDRLDVFLADGLPLRTPVSELAVALRLDRAQAERKLRALRAHATQTDGMVDILGEEEFRDWWSTESFVSAETSALVADPGAWGTWQLVV